MTTQWADSTVLVAWADSSSVDGKLILPLIFLDHQNLWIRAIVRERQSQIPHFSQTLRSHLLKALCNIGLNPLEMRI